MCKYCFYDVQVVLGSLDSKTLYDRVEITCERIGVRVAGQVECFVGNES